MKDSPQNNLFAVTFALVFPFIVTWAYFVALTGHPLQYAAYGLGKTIQFAFPAVWVFIVLREKPQWPTATWRGVPVGAAFGLLVLVSMVGLYHFLLKPMGVFAGPDLQIQEKITATQLNLRWRYIAFAVVYPLFHSLIEEYYWRWFVFRRLQRNVSLVLAIVISSLGFMAHHVIVLSEFFGWGSPATYFFSFCVAFGGAVWAWIYQKSGSLTGPWISHALIDAGIFIIGYDVVQSILL